MRYGEQVFEIDVPLDAVDWSAPDLLDRVAGCFHRRHEELFTYALEDQEVVLVNARVAVTGELPATPREAELPDRPAEALQGPAVVESETTTVLLRPGDRAMVTPFGWLDIAVPGLKMENGT